MDGLFGRNSKKTQTYGITPQLQEISRMVQGITQDTVSRISGQAAPTTEPSGALSEAERVVYDMAIRDGLPPEDAEIRAKQIAEDRTPPEPLEVPLSQVVAPYAGDARDIATMGGASTEQLPMSGTIPGAALMNPAAGGLPPWLMEGLEQAGGAFRDYVFPESGMRPGLLPTGVQQGIADMGAFGLPAADLPDYEGAMGPMGNPAALLPASLDVGSWIGGGAPGMYGGGGSEPPVELSPFRTRTPSRFRGLGGVQPDDPKGRAGNIIEELLLGFEGIYPEYETSNSKIQAMSSVLDKIYEAGNTATWSDDPGRITPENLNMGQEAVSYALPRIRKLVENDRYIDDTQRAYFDDALNKVEETSGKRFLDVVARNVWDRRSLEEKEARRPGRVIDDALQVPGPGGDYFMEGAIPEERPLTPYEEWSRSSGGRRLIGDQFFGDLQEREIGGASRATLTPEAEAYAQEGTIPEGRPTSDTNRLRQIVEPQANLQYLIEKAIPSSQWNTGQGLMEGSRWLAANQRDAQGEPIGTEPMGDGLDYGMYLPMLADPNDTTVTWWDPNTYKDKIRATLTSGSTFTPIAYPTTRWGSVSLYSDVPGMSDVDIWLMADREKHRTARMQLNTLQHTEYHNRALHLDQLYGDGKGPQSFDMLANTMADVYLSGMPRSQKRQSHDQVKRSILNAIKRAPGDDNFARHRNTISEWRRNNFDLSNMSEWFVPVKEQALGSPVIEAARGAREGYETGEFLGQSGSDLYAPVRRELPDSQTDVTLGGRQRIAPPPMTPAQRRVAEPFFEFNYPKE